MLHQRLSISREVRWQQRQQGDSPTTKSTETAATTARAARRVASSATTIVALIILFLVVLTVSRLPLRSFDNKNNNEKTSVNYSDTRTAISTLPSLVAFAVSQQKASSSLVSSGSVVTSDKMELSVPKPNPLRQRQQQQHLVRNQRQHLGCQCTLPVCQTPFYCHRGMIQVHKMGVLLLHELVSAASASFQFPGPVETAEIKGSLAPYFASIHGKQPHDYRHVVVTRNFYQALISGYLYHKGHRECELDHWGHPSKRQRKEWLMQENWEERIMNRKENDYHHRHHIIRLRQSSQAPPWPPGRGRSLCTYLSEESEHHGLQVYMEWATAMYLDPILAFAHYRRRAEHEDGMERTLFWCYEELVQQDGSVTAQRLSEWLFPAHQLNGTATATTIPPDRVKRRAPIEPRDKFQGHATTSDPVVRGRLLNIIRKLDQDIFNGTIGACNRHVFGCGVVI